MERMTTGGKLLAQDDIDALLSEAGVEGDYSSKGPEKEVGPPNKKSTFTQPHEKTSHEIKLVTEILCKKACLKREEGVQIIWNASRVFPMVAGLNLKLQGIPYTSMGVLNEKHLVIECTQ
ncbi:MAG: hypothetical protein ABII06_10345 [Pseudomonadota bacterium]